MSVLRQRLIDADARLARIGSYPWQSEGSCVIAPASRRMTWPGARTNDYLDDLEYYGGDLVCESVTRERADFIAHAPADLSLFVDVVTHLIRERDRLRHLMWKHGYKSRADIDAEISASGARLFTLARAELPRRSVA